MNSNTYNPWTWQEALGFDHAVEVAGAQRVVYLSGQVAADDDGNPLHVGDMDAQLDKALDNVERVLAEAGLTLANLVRLNYYATDIAAFHGGKDRISKRLADAGAHVSSTLLGVAALALPEFLIELEATAVA